MSFVFIYAIPAEAIQTMVSKLSETGMLVPGKPGIEGIVVRRNGEKVKITGEFLDYSKPEDVPTFDATKEVREYVQKSLLGLTTTTLGRIPEKSLAGVHSYIMSKRKKKYSYDIDETESKDYVNEIIELIDKAQKEIKRLLPGMRKKGRAYDERSLLVQSLILSQFKEELKKAEIYEDVINPYAKIFFNIKRKK